MAATQKFTNSGLVSYTKLSPNHSGRRTMNIDQICVHHTGGVCSVETLGAIFAPRSRGASSNYGIGNDGRIAMFVEEKNRSWCTSSAAVDQRGVTIEVSNSKVGEPWPISDRAWDSLVDLCTDICKRNNIKELKWQANKSLLNQTEKQNLVAHRYVAATSCPGPTLYGLFGQLAEKVNRNLRSNVETIRDTTLATLITETNDAIIWNFLMATIGNAFGVAGLMGNLFSESGLIPINLQNTFERSLGLNDDEYTKRVDNGSYTNFVHDGAGYGLAQWTFHTRKQNLLNYARSIKKSIGDLSMQLMFLWQELNNSYGTVLNALKSASSVKEASDVVLTQFEKPLNQSDAVKIARAGYGQSFYNKFAANPAFPPASTAGGSVPYVVKVTASALNIRKGPGTNYPFVSTIRDKGAYTIVKESSGEGASKWGYLKSGLGWISLDYCTKK